MANESIGNIILRLLVDNKAFKEGLVNALQLVQITSQQIKDLTAFKIPAPDIKALDLALEAGEARVRDFIGAQLEVPPAAESANTGLDESGKRHEEHAGKVKTGEQAVREYLAQQRFQNRVVGEGRQSILGLTNAIGFLNVGSAGASSTTKAMQESMLAGIGTANGLEFALFGIGQVGGKLPGVLGSIATGAASMAGPIAAAVGVGALLITFFQKSNEEAQRAVDEGLKNFDEALNRLSRPQTLRLAENVQKQIDQINREIALIKPINLYSEQVVPSSFDTINDEEVKRLKLLESDKTILEGILDKTEKQRKQAEAIARAHKVQEDNLLRVGEVMQQQDILIKRLREEIETRVDAEKKSALTVAEIRDKTDELNRLEAERTKNLRSTLDIQKEFVNKFQTYYDLGQASEQLLLGSLEILRQKQVAQGDLNGAKETELKILRTEQQLAADDVTVAETKRRLGLATTNDVRKVLDAQLELATTEKDQIAIKEKKHQLTISEIELEVSLAEKAFQRGFITSEALNEQYRKLQSVTTERQKQVELEEKIISTQSLELTYLAERKRFQEEFSRKLFELTQVTITNEFESRTVAEQRRFESEKQFIEEKYALSFVREDGLIQLTAEGQALALANEQANQAAIAIITRDRLQAKHDLELFLLGDSFTAELQRINDLYDEQERRARQLYTNKDQLDAVLAQLRKRRNEDIANAELANVQRVLGTAQNIAGNIVSIVRAIEEPAEGFLANFMKALQVAQAIVATVQAMQAISLFFGLAHGGPVASVASTSSAAGISYAASGTEIPGASTSSAARISPGSYVVKKSAVDKNRPLLEALGAREVTGGIAGRDSVAATTPGGGVVMMMPGEMIVDPKFAPIAKAINEGRVQMRAGGGPFDELASVIREYVQVNPTGSSFPIPSNIIQQLQAEISLNGGVNKEVMNALIEEVRGLRFEVRELRSETNSLADRINIKLPEEIELKADGREIRAVIRRDELLDQ